MKKHLILFFLIAPFFNGFSQPGDRHNCYSFGMYKNVQDSIKKYPEDNFYQWVRLEILFRPTFVLYTKSTMQIKEYFKHFAFYSEYELGVDPHNPNPCKNISRVANPVREMGDFLIENTSQLIKDLDSLIEQGSNIKKRTFAIFYYYSANKASYLYKRGQLNYLTGKPAKAKEDYLSALENEPDNNLKKEILLSIAAYYYTQDSITEESQRQALKYLDLYASNGGTNHHNYETEKINLLKSLKDSTTLVNYFHDQAARCWKKYYDQLKIETYKSDRIITDAIIYEQLLFEYLKELNPVFTMEEFKKHKDIITEKIH